MVPFQEAPYFELDLDEDVVEVLVAQNQALIAQTAADQKDLREVLAAGFILIAAMNAAVRIWLDGRRQR